MTVTAKQFADAVLALVGTPFHHQGRVPHVGLDCVGVPICAARACGLSPSDVTVYSMPADPRALLAGLRANCDQDDYPAYSMGTVVLLRIGREAQHLAVFVDHGATMVHALDRKTRAVRAQPFDEQWQSRVVSTWRMRGVGY